MPVKVACLLSASRIPDDPRVRRQGDALSNAGWDVCAVGQPGARSQLPPWRCYDVGAPSPSKAAGVLLSRPPGTMDVRSGLTNSNERRPHEAHHVQGIAELSSRLADYALGSMRLVINSQKQQFPIGSALKIYWSWRVIRELEQASRGIRAQLWVANDWLMLPLAAQLAKERGGVYVYDSHEFAVYEYMERLKWRLFKRPLVEAIEAQYIKNAKVVSTVSEGIADGLQAIYQLPRRPLVIRNTPFYQPVTPAPEGPRIRVLYHGLVAPIRGLEPMIRSAKLWRDEFEITIRGPGDDGYLSSLRRLVESEGLASRVRIEPPIPMTQLIEQAAPFDVGFFCMPRYSHQHDYVLPNKLFEYIMAGLAVCVSDLPEMSRIVKANNVGVLLPNDDEHDIAIVMNSLTREAIRSYKGMSLEAAKRLCWEEEAKILLEAYNTEACAKH